MKPTLLFILVALLFLQCKPAKTDLNTTFIMEADVQKTIDSLIRKHGEMYTDRIKRGVQNVAAFWTQADGKEADFQAYCIANFISDTAALDVVFQRISRNLETINGSFNDITVGLQRQLNLDWGEILPVDEIFGAYSPSTHFADDFFANRLAFYILLNFPAYSLEEKNTAGETWSRKQWAYARMGDLFESRVPAAVSQEVVNAYTRSELYISDYNVYAGKLVNNEGKSLFPEDMKLLSHWNLRDEIKTNYGDSSGLEKQRMLYEVMKRIISQQIPQKVINSNQYTWNPYTNVVTENGKPVELSSEPDTRFDVLLQFFKAQQKVDNYYPRANTYITRTFEGGMEIPLADVESLFKSFLSSAEVAKVADVIKGRLGRDLEPFDIWYDGFKSRTSIPAAQLDAATQKKYPNADAVQKDLPLILQKLGFAKERASEITGLVKVEPARGSGHAWGAVSHNQPSLLRTRIFANGMDYKGYNIAVHEFGHNVEQTISLYNNDYFMLAGVPNTAFTEALAFMFQKNDLKLLGMKDNNQMQQYYDYLDNFWQLFEIMGVSLVDINTWKWLYDHPNASAGELKNAVNNIAREVWNQYYAPVFKIKDQPVLAIYSHMINVPLYLPNYAYGHIIEFQLAEYLKDKNFAGEIERIFSQGLLTPKQWMNQAVGSDISVQPILNSVNLALEALDKQ